MWSLVEKQYGARGHRVNDPCSQGVFYSYFVLCFSDAEDSGGDDEDGGSDKERTCDSLLMCIVTVLSHGLRSGGGVGDVLRKPSKEVRAQSD